MNPANTFTYRHFDPQHDFTALMTLLQIVEQTDQDGEDVSEAMLREQLIWPGHDPMHDRWVVFPSDSDALIGYGVVFQGPDDEHADVHIAVHPQWRLYGIGSQLLNHLLARAHEKGAQDVRAYATVQNSAARAFLSAHGFEPVAMYTRMLATEIHGFPIARMPSGFTVRSYDQVQQLDLLVEAMNRGYEGLWGHRHVEREELGKWIPQFIQEGIFLLFAPGGTVAGMCRAEMSEHLTSLRGVPTALIDAPGIVPEYRETGLHVPLVLTAVQWLIPQAPARIEMESWGDALSTLASYRGLGFTPMQEAISYRRALTK
ncbi:MAG TPA: GNAT family N-acetyltransferase [Ktedonobacteraceae bacterium]|nr:GNAT family N-acetyltransferase [Ktedonobacteraceae bacterium]